jgi:hypothetical protein
MQALLPERFTLCLSRPLSTSFDATIGSVRRKASQVAYQESVADLAKNELHGHLQFRKALLEAQLRGVNKMLQLLPDDSDIRAVLLHC